MAIAEHPKAAEGSTTEVQENNVYERLCDLVEIDPVTEHIEIEDFTTPQGMADKSFSERVTAALQVFLDLASTQTSQITKIDKALLDSFIGKIDHKISEQLDEILHHEEYQKIESSWRSLKYLVDRCDFRANIVVEVLDVSKEDLQLDFEEAPDTTQCGLYKHVYVDDYDTPGGEPVSVMITNYEFGREAPDIGLLTDLSRIAAAAHCPVLGAAGHKFFGKSSVDELPKIHDLANYMERAEYLRWKGFRESEDSRYVGLCLPRFLLRLPYGAENPVRAFNYEEQVDDEGHQNFLWGNATFALAVNIARSFKENGWAVNIRGPEAGGKVEALPIHLYDAGRGLQSKIPTEIIIPETRELEFANAGFIPLSYYKNSDYACFFSANSTQKPTLYTTDEATANSRINSRLPYIFLVSRLAHYLKVLQRENIGSTKDKTALESELNNWLGTLVTEMVGAPPELIATHPLRAAKIIVEEIPDNPGFFKCDLQVMPHFQIEGIDIRLSLVAQLPKDS